MAFAQLQPIKALPVEKSLNFAPATIASGQTASAAIFTNGLTLVGIMMPAAFTGILMTFQGSLDGITYQPVYSTTTGTALSYTVAAAHYVALDPTPFQGLAYLKLVSGSSEAAARALTVSLKGL